MATKEEIWDEIQRLLEEENARPGGPRSTIILKGDNVTVARDMFPDEANPLEQARLHVRIESDVPDLLIGKAITFKTGILALRIAIIRNQVLSDLVPRAPFTATFGDMPEK